MSRGKREKPRTWFRAFLEVMAKLTASIASGVASAYVVKAIDWLIAKIING